VVASSSEAAACSFCGSVVGCEHLLTVLQVDGRRVPVYGEAGARRAMAVAVGRIVRAGMGMSSGSALLGGLVGDGGRGTRGDHLTSSPRSAEVG